MKKSVLPGKVKRDLKTNKKEGKNPEAQETELGEREGGEKTLMVRNGVA